MCHMGQQVRCNMFLHRRTLINPMVNRPRADDFGSGSINNEVIKSLNKLLVSIQKVDADHIRDHILMSTNMLHIHKFLKLMNLLSSLAMIVELHWSI